MSGTKKPAAVANTTLATLYFKKPGAQKSAAYGVAVRFAAHPRVGDSLEVEQNSVRRIPREDLHKTEWTVTDVRHVVNLDPDVATANGEDVPLVTLEVMVATVD